MILLIDNYDSFTYNVVQYLGELGAEVQVHRNDQITLDEIEELNPEKIVISPGPCTPNEAGISVDLVRKFGATTPILGICLGHQSIGQAYGGNIVRAREVMHGKMSSIFHDGEDIFVDLPNGFTATRYHSLVIENESLPSCLEITAWTQFDNGSVDEIMGVRHKEHDVYGVQFHPESIMSESGHDLLNNFLQET